MSEVRQLFATNQFAPTAEDQAVYLESLAARVRNGSLVIRRAVLLHTDADHSVQLIPFGERMNYFEMAGIFQYGIIKALSD